ncbi:translin-associated protein X isoform X1 [Camelus dromedarius]|uniref:translin-associated protein X isoform X1 n=1 Tax=Camelus dromedarius TaxID=9838 RepID=UPI0031198F2B
MSSKEGSGGFRKRKHDNFPHNQRREGKDVHSSSPVMLAFKSFQQELDARHDKYERLVKLSRDITVESKRTIFLLHRITSAPDMEEILTESEMKVDGVRQKILQAAQELSGEDMHQFHRAMTTGSHDCVPPAASYRRRRLSRRPGYLRSTAGPQTAFLSPAVGTPCQAQGGAYGEESQHSESRAGLCGLEPGGRWRGPSARSRVPKSVAASALTSAGHRGLALTAGRGTPGLFGIQLRAGTPQPNRLTRSCGPADAGRQGELPSMDSCAAPSPSREAARGEGARGTRTKGCLSPDEVSGTSCSLRSGPKAPTAPTSSQDVFTSSFSFIRLSLGSAGERGEAEGCPPCREAEGPRQSPEEAEAKAASVDGPHEHPRLHSPTFTLKAPRGLADAAQTAEGSCGLQREMLPWLDRGAASACSPDPACSGGCRPGDPRRWDTLLSKLEPALLHCLQGQRRRLEVKSLRLKLQKLQEKAVEDDDYEKAEMIQRRLEDLEKERGSLNFQLPSRQPALSGLLGHLGAVLRRGAQRAGGDDSQAQLRVEAKTVEPTTQDNLRVSVTRRDWLLQEKQQLQKEIEALQARMSVLEAKEQQLRQEIDEQEQLLPWQGCDLSPLLGGLTPRELQEVHDTLRDTLASASRVPLRAEPPEAIRSLQEGIKSLNLSLKEITAKVCMSERLCSTLRKKLNDIEIQMPALLEAKMLAIAGNHFCTAKELTEEIRSLTSEREGLEGLLHKLSVLSSRNVKKLGNVEEDYNRLRRELDHGRTAYETSVKESATKYMEVLEDKLCSCKCPLLGKVWEADLEACRLLIQSLQLQEARGSLSAEDARQVDDLGGGTCTTSLATPHRLHSEDERKTPLQACEEWKVHLTPSPHCAGSEQKEDSYILSAELGEKCEAIGKKLLYLDDQLHTAIHSHDEDLIQSLKRELQMVKETLQAMILQLQPAKEVGEREPAASCVTAGIQESQA